MCARCKIHIHPPCDPALSTTPVIPTTIVFPPYWRRERLFFLFLRPPVCLCCVSFPLAFHWRSSPTLPISVARLLSGWLHHSGSLDFSTPSGLPTPVSVWVCSLFFFFCLWLLTPRGPAELFCLLRNHRAPSDHVPRLVDPSASPFLVTRSLGGTR